MALSSGQGIWRLPGVDAGAVGQITIQSAAASVERLSFILQYSVSGTDWRAMMYRDGNVIDHSAAAWESAAAIRCRASDRYVVSKGFRSEWHS